MEITTMKKYYEIWLRQHVKGNCPDDYETTAFESYENSYWDFHKLAKQLSLSIGQSSVLNHRFLETNSLDKGLAAVKLVCYTLSDEEGYKILSYEYYENGKGLGRINEDY